MNLSTSLESALNSQIQLEFESVYAYLQLAADFKANPNQHLGVLLELQLHVGVAGAQRGSAFEQVDGTVHIRRR